MLIGALLMLASRRSKAALMNIEFNRIDLAFVDFNVALDTLINTIPNHREYPTWVTRPSNPLSDFKKLRGDMMKHMDRMDEIKKIIVADNIENDTPPPSLNDISATTKSPSPIPSEEQKPVVNDPPAPLDIKHPPPRPAKPKDLQNYHSATDRPPSRGERGAATNGDTQAPKTNSTDLLKERFEKLRQAGGPGSNFSRTTPEPANLRKRLLKPTVSTDVDPLPRPPEPTYSPIRQYPDGSTYFPANSESQPRPLVRASSSTSLDNYRPNNSAQAPAAVPKPSAPLHSLNTGDTTISAERLSEYLISMSALVIDVRERSEFDQGHIFSRDIICIEPTALRDNMSAEQLEDALSLSPDKELTMFKRRHEYDYVVYYDQSTAALNSYQRGTDKPAQRALKVLVQAIYDLAYQKQLKNPPKLLVGGLDAWIEYNGHTSLIQTDASQKVARLSRTGAKTTATSHSTLAARRKERARAALPGQVLPDAERSELMASAQPINQEEEAQWIARLKRENTALTIKNPLAGESGDVKSRNRAASLITIDFERSPDIEEFFQRFPAIGKDHVDGLSSFVGEDTVPQSAAYPTLPVLGSAQKTAASPAPSVHEEQERPPSEQSMPAPTRTPPPVPQLPPPVPAKEPAETTLARRNTIIDHMFHGFTDVQNPQFHPIAPPSPLRPPPAVPKKSYSGVSERHQPQAPALDPITSPFIAPVTPSGFGTTGLKNLGNTCYMNSIIQCMSGTVPLARYFLSGSYRLHINRENRLGSRGIFAEAFANLNRNLWEETYAFVSPVTIKDISGRLNSQFRGRDQQDAQEYLEFFLDYLHEDLNANAGKPKLRDLTEHEERCRESLPVQLASYYEWERYTHTNLSMIVKWFQGQFRSQLKCLKCGHTSTTYSPFMYLSLPIPASAKGGSGGCTLKDCMDEFTKEEILDGDDAWHCPICKKPRRASKQLSISRMPIVLIIHLKRFSSHGMWRDKVNTMVNFGKSVDLTKYVPAPLDPDNMPGGKAPPATSDTTPPFHYSLYAVTNHYGSLTSGHYTAFVRVSGGSSGGGGQVGAGSVWHRFDDTKATKMENDDVVTRAEVLVDQLRLIVALRLLASLLLEPQPLIEGVVQLGVGVYDFLLAHECLEALTETALIAMVLGERGHHLRVSGDEGRRNTRLLDELADELVQHTRVGQRRRALDLELLEQISKELVGLHGVQLVAGRELLARRLLQLGHHLDAAPRPLPVDFVHFAGLRVELGAITAGDVLDEAGNELLCQVHDVVDVRVRPVELAGGEFRVMCQVDALVSELAADFVDALETTDDQHLEVEFWGDTHEEVHVELVMVRDEWLSGGTAGDGVHHGRFDFDKFPVVEELADVCYHLGASDEGLAGTLVHDQVEVSLAVAGLLVLEAEVLGGEHVQGGREEGDLADKDGEFAGGSCILCTLGVCVAGETDNADNVTTTEMLVLGGEFGAGGIGEVGNSLDAVAVAADFIEAELVAEGAVGVDSAGDSYLDVGSLFTGLEVCMGGEEVGDVILDVELVRFSLFRALVDQADLLLHRFDDAASLLSFLLWTHNYIAGQSKSRHLLALGLLLLAQLEPLLEFGLGDHLAGGLIEVEVGDAFCWRGT
ncbi:Ubiquitin carboxyl-terminal hydrolase [Drechslerella dactyloides]|uniref:ubiquitinyl hydrolase 1 n=1 Tax=Drechslerella dactyloides TaxID=74499 RepID=A0AAD6NGY7_DREDA|nr:Ubiquitin carboxyl-terminal hydrolase [Drechslerella dactyloides]